MRPPARSQDGHDQEPFQVELEHIRLAITGRVGGDRFMKHVGEGGGRLDVPLAGGDELQDLSHDAVRVVNVVDGTDGGSVPPGDEIRQHVLTPMDADAIGGVAGPARIAGGQQDHPIRALVGLEQQITFVVVQPEFRGVPRGIEIHAASPIGISGLYHFAAPCPRSVEDWSRLSLEAYCFPVSITLPG